MSPTGPLFFVGSSPATGTELWRLDSPTGTPTVVDVIAGPRSSEPFHLTAVGPVLYFTAHDGTGNALYKLSGVLPDTGAPRLTCPADAWVVATDATGARVTFSPAAAHDDSGEAPTVTVDPASGAVFPVGVTPVTFSAVDGAGNRGTCTFSVTVAPVGTVDAGTPGDGGTDGGAPDGGTDPVDAGTDPVDAGTDPVSRPVDDSGCGCQSASASVPWSLLLLGLWFMARRHTRGHSGA
ncbi:HYR domain-containing protein [Pyxidicoccus sp. 3LFB2]